MSGYIAGFVALLCLSAVFSAGESAYTQANRLRITPYFWATAS